VWPRCDAECSPLLKATITILLATRPADRGRMGLPVHRLAQLRPRVLDRPLDVECVLPAKDPDEVAAKQVKVLLGQLGKVQTVPLFVFDVPSTIP
jgi:hypothetical protein